MKQIKYSDHYLNYGQDYKANFSHYEMIVNQLNGSINKDDKILDIGCTTGKLVYSLNKLGYKNVLGVDFEISRDLVDIGIKEKLNLITVESINKFLKKNDQTFDVIFLLDVLEHIPINDQIEFLSQIRRSLNEKGFLIIQVPNANSIISNRIRYIDWTHKISFTEDSLNFILKQSNFQKILIKEIRYHYQENNLLKKIIVNFIKRIIRSFYKILLYSELDRSTIKNINLSPNLFCIAKK